MVPGTVYQTLQLFASKQAQGAVSDLSRLTGIAHDSISQLETGKRDAQPRTIRNLAEALGVEPKELTKED